MRTSPNIVTVNNRAVIIRTYPGVDIGSSKTVDLVIDLTCPACPRGGVPVGIAIVSPRISRAGITSVVPISVKTVKKTMPH